MSEGHDVVTDFRIDDGDKIEVFHSNTREVSIQEHDSYTLLTSATGDTMKLQDASGLDVYKSISDHSGGTIFAENFDITV